MDASRHLAVADVDPDVRALHLFANHKWTGPADPAIRSAAGLRARGWDVAFAEAGFVQKGGFHRMAVELERAGMPVVTGLQLRKHFNALAWVSDARRLVRLVERDGYRILHAHLLGDHLTAARAVRRLRAGSEPRLVRSLYDPEPPSPREWRARLSMARTDGVVVPTAACGDALAGAFGLPRDRVLVLEPPIRPRERTPEARALGRRRLGLADDEVAVGITARIQPHRRFDLLWEVARAVVARHPRTRFVLLGRGDPRDVERLVHRPVAEAGLGEHVVLPGYLMEPDYGHALAALDVFVFLVPGSDGTCRAVREAMAAGLPVVSTRAGMLPELIGPPGEGGVAGGVAVPEGGIAEAVLGFVSDPARRRAAGRAAAARARTAMDPDAAARRLGAFYLELLGRPSRRSEVAGGAGRG